VIQIPYISGFKNIKLSENKGFLRPDLPEKMPKELEEELETIKQNEFRIVNFDSNRSNERVSGDNKMNGKESFGQSQNSYREEYSPIY
jgi:hypothetical protein